MTDKILWQLPCQLQQETKLYEFINYISRKYELSFSDYYEFYDWSITANETFWQEFLNFSKILLHENYASVLKKNKIFNQNKWFDGARLNFAENLLDSTYNHKRLSEDPNYVALIAINESGKSVSYTLAEIKEQVNALAEYFKMQGISRGDVVAGLIPNIAEAVIGMLAAASLGAVWTACSPDFGIDGILERFQQVQPKLLLIVKAYEYKNKSFDCTEKNINVVDALKSSLHGVIVISNDSRPIDEEDFAVTAIYWSELLKSYKQTDKKDTLNYVSIDFNDPIYIMFSSGTTGKPKCIVHGAGGVLIEHFKEHLLHHDISSADTFFYFTTTSWMMWHWQISALGLGATIVIYDGAVNYPTANSLIDLIDRHHITVFGASAKYYSSLEKAGLCLMGSNCLTSLRMLLSTGSPLLGEQFDYIYDHVKKNVALCSISGGTDILGCFALGNPLVPIYKEQLQCRSLGLDIKFLSEEGQELLNEKGELVCCLPFPSMPIYFFNDPDGSKYEQAYFTKFDNIWAHGDYGKITKQKGIILYGRSDAVLNPGGVRIGTAEIYAEVEQISEIVESLAVGQYYDNDERIILFVVLKNNVQLTEDLKNKIKSKIKTGASPRHVPALILQAPELPRTTSGKLVEIAVKKILAGEEVKNKSALSNPECLMFFKKIPELE